MGSMGRPQRNSTGTGPSPSAAVAEALPVVLDRAGMLDSAPFPAFPIRLPLPEAGGVPALDEHHGEGFCERG